MKKKVPIRPPALTADICVIFWPRRRELRDIRCQAFPSRQRVYHASAVSQGQAACAVAGLQTAVRGSAQEILGYLCGAFSSGN